jgi:hypothetical protein
MSWGDLAIVGAGTAVILAGWALLFWLDGR